ncbi:MAG: hypothetical protein K2W96_01870 [Gemmataceae bacterium]|nr:hypothetical protein [Gemmataceae bacterium]
MRDIIGNPFHPAFIDASLRTPTVLSIARAVYSARPHPAGELDPVHLSILADALEEGGGQGEILTHLRAPGPHVRGCWALDLVLADRSQMVPR